MAGRGDNNKHGSAGRGAANQSNQAFIANDHKHPKSNHGDQTGTHPSTPQPKTQDVDANRGVAKKRERKEIW